MFANLTPIHLIFYMFATVAMLSALAVITARNPVRSVLSLVVTFFAMAGIWMMLRAEFLSLMLVLVYVGAVMTLFLFVVMMLNIEREKNQSGFVKYFPIALIIILAVTSILILGFGQDSIPHMQHPVEDLSQNNTQQLGRLLFTEYYYPFEIAGVLLLTAIIAAIVLTHRAPTRRKGQDPAAQVAVRPEDRLILVKMAAEPKINHTSSGEPPQ